MNATLLELLSGRSGHFQMESGYHSDLWFELDRLLAHRERLQPFVSELGRRIANHRVDIVCGPMTGGAKLAEVIAPEIGATACIVERFESSARNGLFPIDYRVPPDARPHLRGKRIAIVDDAISAGSAVRGTYADLIRCGARPVVVAALFVFGGKAASFAAERGLSLEAIAHLDFNIWKPEECPLCKAGEPVEKVSDAP